MKNDLTGQSSVPANLQQPKDVSRRQLFHTVAVAVGSAAVLAAAAAIPQRAEAGAMTKQAAGYKDTPKGDQRCDNCAQFKAPSSCNLVAGDISPAGWCRLWVKKS